ncbi:MAG: bifunctional precorrin-2 dehydrogenase/sirohydrochlorin ferrochelatase [Candidatus Zixiibacteriota bacterium]
MANTYLPIGISLKKRSCLVVGGGKVALRKIETLLEYDATVTVVATEPLEKIRFHASKGKLKLEQREYRSPEAKSYGLVISASDKPAVNREVSEDCRLAGVPVNVVDSPSLCDVILPAVVRRDCLTVSVLTDGKAPFLAGHLRLILEGVFPKRWSTLAGLAAKYRTMVRKRWKGQPDRKAAAFQRFLETDWQKILKGRSAAQLEQELQRLLEG